MVVRKGRTCRIWVEQGRGVDDLMAPTQWGASVKGIHVSVGDPHADEV